MESPGGVISQSLLAFKSDNYVSKNLAQHLIAGRPWSSDLTFLRCAFPTCKIGSRDSYLCRVVARL